MMCYCFLRNAVDIQKDEKTAYEKRFGSPFSGPLIPMGAAIDYKPSSDKDSRRTHEFSASVLPGIFMGYSQQAGGGWNGDLLVLDQERAPTLADPGWRCSVHDGSVWASRSD